MATWTTDEDAAGYSLLNAASVALLKNSASATYLNIFDTTAPTNQKNWRWILFNGADYRLQTVSDDFASTVDVIKIDRSALIPTLLRFFASTVSLNAASIELNGSVGIGAASPGFKLHVVGDCNISGNYKINGVNISTSQTPWTSDIDGGGFKLLNTLSVRTDGLEFPKTGNLRWKIKEADSGYLYFERFNSSGVSQGTPLFIYNSGDVAISAGLGVANTCNLINASGDLYIGVTARNSAISVPTDGAANSGAFVISTTNAGSLTEKLRITASGILKVGNPYDVGYKFACQGNGRFEGNLDVEAGHLTLYGSAKHITGNGGYVAGFTGYYGSGDSEFQGIVYIGNTTAVRHGSISVIQDGPTNSGAMLFSTRNAGTLAERMRISAAGDINITGNGSIGLHFGGLRRWKVFIDATGKLIFERFDAAGASQGQEFSITSSGIAVFKGQLSVETFCNLNTISGVTYIGVTERRARMEVVQDGVTNSGALTFWTNNAGTLTEKVRISASGNVGIGVASPGYKLDVAGDGAFSSNIASVSYTGAGITIRERGRLSGTSSVNDSPRIAFYWGGVNVSQIGMDLNVSGILRTFDLNGTGYAPFGCGALNVTGDCNITGSYKVNGVNLSTGGSQTPWISDIDGGNHNLGNVLNLQTNGYVWAQGWVTTNDLYADNSIQVRSGSSGKLILLPTYLTFTTTGDIPRWNIQKFGIESGSNSGSDFYLQRFDDAGVSLGNPFFISRASGNVGIKHNSPSYTIDVNGDINFTGKLYHNGVEVDLGTTDLTPVLNRLPIALVGGKMDSVMSAPVTIQGDLTTEMKVSIRNEISGEFDESGSELDTIPTTAGSIRRKIDFLFQYFRNKRTITSSQETLFKEGGSDSLGGATVQDDGLTVTISEKT